MRAAELQRDCRNYWEDCKAFVALHVGDLSEVGSCVRGAFIIIGLSLATLAEGGRKQGSIIDVRIASYLVGIAIDTTLLCVPSSYSSKFLALSSPCLLTLQH